MQGKASSMVAAALFPELGWEVLDACAARGNKTVHLAALMKRKRELGICPLSNKPVSTHEGSGSCKVPTSASMSASYS